MIRVVDIAGDILKQKKEKSFSRNKQKLFLVRRRLQDLKI